MSETLAERQVFVVSSSVCLHHFGFLGQRSKGTEIPDECLICEKILECMSLRPKDDAPKLETSPEFSAEEAKISFEESGKKSAEERLEEDAAKHTGTDELTGKSSDNDFTVKSPGMLYAQWSGTVLICRETLQRWGKKIKEVEIETDKGKRIKCKVHPIEDSETRVVQVPDKMQLTLGVRKGSIIKVKPVVESQQQSLAERRIILGISRIIHVTATDNYLNRF